MDSFPTNVERIAAAPFSLDAARRRHVPAESPEPAREAPTEAPARTPRRHPRLELVAGSFVPEPTGAQITDARDRFLSRIVRELPPAASPSAQTGGHAQPTLTLLRRTPRLLPWDDGGRPGA